MPHNKRITRTVSARAHRTRLIYAKQFFAAPHDLWARAERTARLIRVCSALERARWHS